VDINIFCANGIIFYDNLQIILSFQSTGTQSSFYMQAQASTSSQRPALPPQSFDKSNFVLKLMDKEPNITWYNIVTNVDKNLFMRKKKIGKIDCQ